MKSGFKNIAFIMLGIAFFSATAQEQKPAEATKQTTLQKDGTDPVCGMKVKKGTTLVSVHKGQEYGFCGKMCKEQFDKKPKKYVK